MSRIGSSSGVSGVRVAATPLSNVYTVLLLIGAVLLVLTLIGLWVTMDKRYGVVWGVTDQGKAALKAPDMVKAEQEEAQKKLNEKAEALKQFPAGVVPAAPGTAPESPPTAPATPATPAPATPPAAAPATPPAAAPATPPAAAPATPPAAAPATPPAAK